MSRVCYIESLDLKNFWENNQNVRYIELGIVNDYFLTPSILERRKKKMKQFKQAKKDGKTAFFSRAEPDKLFIDGVEM